MALYGSSSNVFRIENFETIVANSPKPIASFSTNPIRESAILHEYLNNTFTINELEEKNQIIRIVQIKDENISVIGKFSCLRFPGYERYRKVNYRIYNPKANPDGSFMERRSPDSGFYAFAYQKQTIRELFFAWKEISIRIISF